MKKICMVCLLAAAAVISFMMTACSSEKPLAITYMEYEKTFLTLEEMIKKSDVAIVGEYVETIRHDNYIEQKFKVKECLYGDVADSEIYLYSGTGVGHIEEIDYTYELGADVYEVGMEYILILERAQSVMYEHDRYMQSADVFLCDSVGEYRMYSQRVEIPAEVTLKDYITSTYEAVSHPAGQAASVLYEDEIARMMGESDYVGRVKILELVNEGKTHNGNVYRCSVESLSKGDDLNTYDDGTVLIVILKNTVETDNSYIIGFSSVDEGSLIYTQSTDASVYDIDDERIFDIL